MHAFLNLLAVTTTTVGKSSKKSSNTWPFLIILVVFFAVYMLFIRPRSQRMRQQQGAARALSVGDPVVTAGGIQGRVVAMDDSVAEVEIAPGVVITVLRRAISPRVDATPAPSAGAGSPGDQDRPGEQGQLDAPPLANTAQPFDEPGSNGLEQAVDAGEDDLPGDQSTQHP